MKELYVFCEGATEQGFCKQVLAPHLFPNFDGQIHTIKTAFNKHHGRVSRGGLIKYSPLRRDIQNTLRSRRGSSVFFTSMIDLYALPKDFPGMKDTVKIGDDVHRYVDDLERASALDIGDTRFIPHIQLHEYETILFADPEAFRISFDDGDEPITELARIAALFPTIEHIDDGAETAPSKRIIGVFPGYRGLKTSAGPDIAEYIGLKAIREKCRHLDEWIIRLEKLT